MAASAATASTSERGRSAAPGATGAHARSRSADSASRRTAQDVGKEFRARGFSVNPHVNEELLDRTDQCMFTGAELVSIFKRDDHGKILSWGREAPAPMMREANDAIDFQLENVEFPSQDDRNVAHAAHLFRLTVDAARALLSNAGMIEPGPRHPHGGLPLDKEEPDSLIVLCANICVGESYKLFEVRTRFRETSSYKLFQQFVVATVTPLARRRDFLQLKGEVEDRLSDTGSQSRQRVSASAVPPAISMAPTSMYRPSMRNASFVQQPASARPSPAMSRMPQRQPLPQQPDDYDPYFDPEQAEVDAFDRVSSQRGPEALSRTALMTPAACKNPAGGGEAGWPNFLHRQSDVTELKMVLQGEWSKAVNVGDHATDFHFWLLMSTAEQYAIVGPNHEVTSHLVRQAESLILRLENKNRGGAYSQTFITATLNVMDGAGRPAWMRAIDKEAAQQAKIQNDARVPRQAGNPKAPAPAPKKAPAPKPKK